MSTPSTSVIKRRVLEALGSYLAPVVAPVISAGNVLIGDAGTEHDAPFPHLVVRPAGPTWEFEPFDDDEMWTTPSTQTVQVGDIGGHIELVLGFTNQVQREQVEQLVLESFFGQTDQNGFSRRGVLVVQLDQFLVSDALNLAAVPVAYLLDTETWDEEQVFERKRFSSLAINVDLPALVTRTGVYDMTTLVAALTNDLASNVPTDQVQVLGTDYPLIAPYTGA